jgi:hypothetical protein
VAEKPGCAPGFSVGNGVSMSRDISGSCCAMKRPESEEGRLSHHHIATLQYITELLLPERPIAELGLAERADW